MRPILFGLIAVLLGCLGIEVPTDHTSTVSGTFGLNSVAFSPTAPPCYTSTMADPTLVPPDVNTAFITGGTLTLEPTERVCSMRITRSGTRAITQCWWVPKTAPSRSPTCVTEWISGSAGRASQEMGKSSLGMLRSGQSSRGAPGCQPRHYAAIRFHPSVSGTRTA